MSSIPEPLGNVLHLPASGRERTALESALGRLVGVNEQGAPLVALQGEPGSPRPARATVDLLPAHLGAEVTLLLDECGEAVITGVIRPLEESGRRLVEVAGCEVKLEGDRLVLAAQKEIELRCGKARFVLTEDGKVFTAGTSLLQASSGPNRIQGATVEIN